MIIPCFHEILLITFLVLGELLFPYISRLSLSVLSLKQLLEPRENAAVLGLVGIPGRWLALCGSGGSSLHLPPATGSTARGGASGQSQPQPYGINFIGSLVDILGIEAAARLELEEYLLEHLYLSVRSTAL